MLFNSIPFAMFALTVLAVWPIARRTDVLRWLTLTIASLVFYGYHKETRWPSLVYITLAGLLVYLLGIAVESGRRKKLWFYVGLVVTIGGLAVFKYAGFIAQGINDAFGTSLPVHYPMPLAVSFISFQLASYLIDVRRGQLKACHRPLQFFAYVTFFPKLIAGPVVRGSVLLTQLEHHQPTTADQRWQGIKQFSIGLFKKNVIADNLAQIVNVAFSVAPANSSGYWWAMAIIYTVQSYADFSGYSDMAIGMARLLGFEIPPNFAHPFTAAGFREFWGRWHISVSTWFRDYLFYPLAKGWLPKVRPALRHLAMHVILWIVMVVSGVWHGVAPGYAIWGALNAVYLSVETIYNWPKRLSRTVVGYVIAVLITFLLWSFSQIIFRATDLSTALRTIKVMLSFNTFDMTEVVADARHFRDAWWPVLVGAVAVEHIWVAYRRRTGNRPLPAWVEWAQPIGIAFLLLCATLLQGPPIEFVYFKF